MTQHTLPEDPFVQEVGFRFRVPLPIVIPLGALAVIALLAVGFSRVLLSVPKEAAVVIALVTAVNVLAACAVIAYRPRARVAELVAVALYPVIVGIAMAQFGIGEEAAGGHGAQEAQAAGGEGGTTVTAQSLQFGTDQLELPAKEKTTVTFENEDSVEHNIAIYETEKAQKDLFVGEVIPGGETIDYEVPAIPKGEYFFQCDVHPSMKGDVTVQ